MDSGAGAATSSGRPNSTGTERAVRRSQLLSERERNKPWRQAKRASQPSAAAIKATADAASAAAAAAQPFQDEQLAVNAFIFTPSGEVRSNPVLRAKRPAVAAAAAAAAADEKTALPPASSAVPELAETVEATAAAAVVPVPLPRLKTFTETKTPHTPRSAREPAATRRLRPANSGAATHRVLSSSGSGVGSSRSIVDMSNRELVRRMAVVSSDRRYTHDSARSQMWRHLWKRAIVTVIHSRDHASHASVNKEVRAGSAYYAELLQSIENINKDIYLKRMEANYYADTLEFEAVNSTNASAAASHLDTTTGGGGGGGEPNTSAYVLRGRLRGGGSGGGGAAGAGSGRCVYSRIRFTDRQRPIGYSVRFQLWATPIAGAGGGAAKGSPAANSAAAAGTECDVFVSTLSRYPSRDDHEWSTQDLKTKSISISRADERASRNHIRSHASAKNGSATGGVTHIPPPPAQQSDIWYYIAVTSAYGAAPPVSFVLRADCVLSSLTGGVSSNSAAPSGAGPYATSSSSHNNNRRVNPLRKPTELNNGSSAKNRVLNRIHELKHNSKTYSDFERNVNQIIRIRDRRVTERNRRLKEKAPDRTLRFSGLPDKMERIRDEHERATQQLAQPSHDARTEAVAAANALTAATTATGTGTVRANVNKLLTRVGATAIDETHPEAAVRPPTAESRPLTAGSIEPLPPLPDELLRAANVMSPVDGERASATPPAGTNAASGGRSGALDGTFNMSDAIGYGLSPLRSRRAQLLRKINRARESKPPTSASPALTESDVLKTGLPQLDDEELFPRSAGGMTPISGGGGGGTVVPAGGGGPTAAEIARREMLHHVAATRRALATTMRTTNEFGSMLRSRTFVARDDDGAAGLGLSLTTHRSMEPARWIGASWKQSSANIAPVPWASTIAHHAVSHFSGPYVPPDRTGASHLRKANEPYASRTIIPPLRMPAEEDLPDPVIDAMLPAAGVKPPPDTVTRRHAMRVDLDRSTNAGMISGRSPPVSPRHHPSATVKRRRIQSARRAPVPKRGPNAAPAPASSRVPHPPTAATAAGAAVATAPPALVKAQTAAASFAHTRAADSVLPPGAISSLAAAQNAAIPMSAGASSHAHTHQHHHHPQASNGEHHTTALPRVSRPTSAPFHRHPNAGVTPLRLPHATVPASAGVGSPTHATAAAGLSIDPGSLPAEAPTLDWSLPASAGDASGLGYSALNSAGVSAYATGMNSIASSAGAGGGAGNGGGAGQPLLTAVRAGSVLGFSSNPTIVPAEPIAESELTADDVVLRAVVDRIESVERWQSIMDIDALPKPLSERVEALTGRGKQYSDFLTDRLRFLNHTRQQHHIRRPPPRAAAAANADPHASSTSLAESHASTASEPEAETTATATDEVAATDSSAAAANAAGAPPSAVRVPSNAHAPGRGDELRDDAASIREQKQFIASLIATRDLFTADLAFLADALPMRDRVLAERKAAVDLVIAEEAAVAAKAKAEADAIAAEAAAKLAVQQKAERAAAQAAAAILEQKQLAAAYLSGKSIPPELAGVVPTGSGVIASGTGTAPAAAVPASGLPVISEATANPAVSDTAAASSGMTKQQKRRERRRLKQIEAAALAAREAAAEAEREREAWKVRPTPPADRERALSEQLDRMRLWSSQLDDEHAATTRSPHKPATAAGAGSGDAPAPAPTPGIGGIRVRRRAHILRDHSIRVGMPVVTYVLPDSHPTSVVGSKIGK